MTSNRRRTRSNFGAANNNTQTAEDPESVHKDTDVLFGRYEFLESHSGTKYWASIVGSYSHQCYWSSNLYQKIRSDKRLAGRRYFVFQKENKKFRPAAEFEILDRTCAIFDSGGGKKNHSRKRKSSNSTNEAEIDTSEGGQFQEGDRVFVYDQLYRAKIVEVGDFSDGVKFKVHFPGYLESSDQWVDRVQIFPHSKLMEEMFNELDKSEETGEYDVEEADGDEEGEYDAAAKKRRKSHTRTRKGAASNQNSREAAPAPTNKRRSTRSSSSTSITAVSESSDESNDTSVSDYNDFARLVNDRNSEILSHRLFSPKPNSKVILNTPTKVSTGSTEAIEVTTSTTTPITFNPTLDLSQTMADALEKCESAKEKAKASGMTAIVPLLNAEAANWSLGTINRYLNVGEIQTNLPQLDEMQSNVDKWKQKGGIQGLEAMAMERNIQKWNKAREHLARFLECLVEDL